MLTCAIYPQPLSQECKVIGIQHTLHLVLALLITWRSVTTYNIFGVHNTTHFVLAFHAPTLAISRMTWICGYNIPTLSNMQLRIPGVSL